MKGAPDVVFDVGNVILFFDYGVFGRRIAPDCACSLEEMPDLLREPAWQMEARGMLPDAFFRVAAERLGYRGDQAGFVAAWQDIFEPNEPVIRWIARLKEQGNRLFLLSNTNPWHAAFFLARYPVFSLFDGKVFSHEERCAKPEPRIYRTIIDRFGLEPSRTIYVDDLSENVEAGRAAGLVSIRYEGQDLAEEWESLAPVPAVGNQRL